MSADPIDFDGLEIDDWLAAVLQATARELEREEVNYLEHPALWVRDRTGEHLWSMQVEIVESVKEHRYTAVQSCHDSGKSFIASRLAAWWIDSHPPGEAFVVSTAPTAAQVYAILWREISKAHKKGKLTGRIVSSGYPQWKIGNELVGYGRKPADYEESAFQGIHAKYVLIIMDEACGIDRNLFDAVDSLATNALARVLAIGNPDDPGSHFAQVCQPDSGWNTIRIDGLRTPNLTRAQVAETVCPICQGPPKMLRRLMREEGVTYTTEEIPDELRHYLLSPLWIEERLHRWVGPPGENQTLSMRAAQSSLFTSKVRGLFPDSGSEGVIPLGWIERAIDRWRDWDAAGRPEPPGRLILGVDVAREGEDETCIARRQHQTLIEVKRYQQMDTVQTTELVRQGLNQPHAFAVVDAVGVGGGVVDQLRHSGQPVFAFVASAKTAMRDITGQFRFRNTRSAAWWRLREMLDPARNPTLMLPDDDMMRADLVAPRWQVYAGAIIGVEPKDSIKKRLGRSTDTGDAVIQATWVDAEPVVLPTDGGSGALSWWEGTNYADDSDDWDGLWK